MFKSTLSPHVTALGAQLNADEIKTILQSYTGTAKYNNLAELTSDLDHLLTPNSGSDQSANKQRISHMMVLASRAAQAGKIKKELYQELMQTGAVLHQMLEKIQTTGAPDPESFRHYLNLHQKFSGLLISRGKKDVLVDSLVTNIASNKKSKSAVEGFASEKLSALSDEQKELFTELMKLQSHIITPESQRNWEDFCYEATQKYPNILRNLVGNITKLHLHDFWLNTDFVHAYADDKEHALMELDRKFDAGRDQRSRLIESGKIIDALEQQIGKWSEPANFIKLHENLTKSLDTLNTLLTIDDTDALNSQLAFMQLHSLVDTIDKSIKALQTSSLYEDKAIQVQNFKTILGTFMTLLEQHVDQAKVLKSYIYDNRGNQYQAIEYIRHKLSEVDSSSIEQLLPSKSFSVLETNLYQKEDLGFIRGMSHIETLADLHTVVHQNLLITLQYRAHAINDEIKKILPDKLKKLLSELCTLPTINVLPVEVSSQMEKAEIINTEFTLPKINVLINMPLRNHSCTIRLQYDCQSEETTVHYHFVGHAPGRWKMLETKAKSFISNLLRDTVILSNVTANSVDVAIRLPQEVDLAQIPIGVMSVLAQDTLGDTMGSTRLLPSQRANFPLWSAVLTKHKDLPLLISRAIPEDVSWALSRIEDMDMVLSKTDNIEMLIAYELENRNFDRAHKLLDSYPSKINNLDKIAQDALERKDFKRLGFLIRHEDKITIPNFIETHDKLVLDSLCSMVQDGYVDFDFMSNYTELLIQTATRKPSEFRVMLQGNTEFIARLLDLCNPTELQIQLQSLISPAAPATVFDMLDSDVHVISQALLKGGVVNVDSESEYTSDPESYTASPKSPKSSSSRPITRKERKSI
jgi:hypothetical protein